MTKFYSTLVLLAFSTLFSLESQAQCKLFTQKKCFGILENYTNTGSYNGAVMFEGEEATMNQTFYEGQDYRLVLCTQEVLASVAYFELIDFKGSVLYSSEGNAGGNSFDFSAESTQNLKIRVVVPTIGNNQNLKQNGCVSVLVGFKNSETGDTQYQFNQLTQ